MTVLSPSVPEGTALSVTGDVVGPGTPEIDRSCRAAVLTLFMAATCWLALGALLGVISGIKAHGPGFLAGSAWLTYGRVRPVAANALVYGFILQAGLGAVLWLSCRLGRSLLRGKRTIFAATSLWNIGLLLGVGLILAGGSTGYEWLEIPGSAALILFIGYVLAGAWALITFHGRAERELYVSQWFLLAGLLWFPWIYSTAQLLLSYHPVRGVVQEIVRAWYVQNLFELALAPLGLAVIFYLLPKLLNRPLHSRGLALFGFWFLVLLGGWGSVTEAQPAPNWVSSVTAVSRVFLLVPLLAFGMSWYRTWTGRDLRAKPDPALPFVLSAAVLYLLAALLNTLSTLPEINRVTGYTLFAQGITQIQIHGFLAMALAGIVYHIVPRVSGTAWPAPKWIRLHFGCALFGTLLTAGALIIGGLVQGSGINDAQRDFLSVVKATLPFLGTSTLGLTLLAVGYIVFFVHLARVLIAQCGCCDWKPLQIWDRLTKGADR